jgi:hypothetical protein
MHLVAVKPDVKLQDFDRPLGEGKLVLSQKLVESWNPEIVERPPTLLSLFARQMRLRKFHQESV